jgi:hypothetical protein
MSYEIEYSKHAFKGTDHLGNEAFFTYAKTASNNVSPRTPIPRLIKAGWAYEIIGEACRIGAVVESGCWKPRNRWSTPEAYIRSWRQKLKEARPFEEFTRENPLAEIEIAVRRDAFQTYLDTPPANPNPAGWTKIRIQELLKHGVVKEDRPFFNEKLLLLKINLRTFSDVEKAVELSQLIRDVGLLYWQALRNC